MADNARTAGSVLTLSLDLTDSDAPVTGQTAYLVIRRARDGKLYNWSTHTWAAFAWPTMGGATTQLLTDNGDSTYSVAWDHGLRDASTCDTYTMYYVVPSGDYEGLYIDHWSMVPGTASSVVAAATTAGAAMDETNLQLQRNSPITIGFAVVDDTGTAINITGSVIYFTVKATPNSSDATDADALIQITCTITNGAGGLCAAALTEVEVNSMVARTSYYWDLKDVSLAGIYAKGTITTVWAVTGRQT